MATQFTSKTRVAVAFRVFRVANTVVVAQTINATVRVVAMRPVETNGALALLEGMVALSMVGAGSSVAAIIILAVVAVEAGLTVANASFRFTFNWSARPISITGIFAQRHTTPGAGPSGFAHTFHCCSRAFSVTIAVNRIAKLFTAWSGWVGGHKTLVATLITTVFAFPPDRTGTLLLVQVAVTVTGACFRAHGSRANNASPSLLANTCRLNTDKQFLIVALSMPTTHCASRRTRTNFNFTREARKALVAFAFRALHARDRLTHTVVRATVGASRCHSATAARKTILTNAAGFIDTVTVCTTIVGAQFRRAIVSAPTTSTHASPVHAAPMTTTTFACLLVASFAGKAGDARTFQCFVIADAVT